MTETSICNDCKYFHGYDGVGELWTGCSLLGDFKGSKKTCNHFEKKITKSDLLKRIRELEAENKKLVEEKKRLIYHINQEPKGTRL